MTFFFEVGFKEQNLRHKVDAVDKAVHKVSIFFGRLESSNSNFHEGLMVTLLQRRPNMKHAGVRMATFVNVTNRQPVCVYARDVILVDVIRGGAEGAMYVEKQNRKLN
jgi:hypothetical protein